jgi:zinc transporter 2
MHKKKGDVIRRQSIRYIVEDDAPLLEINSLDRGDVDADEDEIQKIDSLFMYDDEEDVYRVNSQRKSRLKTNDKHMDSEVEFTQTTIKSEKENSGEDENINIPNMTKINSNVKNTGPLFLIMLSYLIFSIIELFFGCYSNSITLMADASHYFAESSCFCIYIIAIYTSRKRATNDMSFGFHRGEIIGVLVRATFLLGFSFWLLYYTILSFIHNEPVNGLVIIILGIISTLFYLIMGLILIYIGINNTISFETNNTCQHKHSEEDLNCNSIRTSFTHVIFNSLQSCIIILAGVLVYFMPSILYIDPICSLILISVLLYNAFNHIKGSIQILMEGSPLEFDVEKLKDDLLGIKGVIDVHDIHVWSLSIGKLSMSCHLITSDPQNSLITAREIIKKRYNINHTTIQVELNKNKKNKCKGNMH